MLVTFKKDIHVVDRKKGVDRYFCFDDTTDVSKEELKLVDDRADELGLKDVYVNGAKDLREKYVGPRVDSPSHPDNQKDEKAGK